MKKLVVIDDEYLVIEGIRVMLKRIGKDYELVGSASDPNRIPKNANKEYKNQFTAQSP